MHLLRSLLFVVFVGTRPLIPIHAQTPADSTTLRLSVEYRPRTEFRHGYRQLPATGSKPAFFTSHRARINLDVASQKFRLYASLQDIRVWGEEDTRDPAGDAQFFEFYAEPLIAPHLKARIGRQVISYADERLFASNNWRQSGGKHDALRLMYKKSALGMDLIAAFNQTRARNFGTLYDPGFDFYKILLAHFFSWKPSPTLTVTGINFADGYQDAKGSQKTQFKYTQGGILALQGTTLRFTLAAYSQHGKIESGEKIRAWYLDPQLSFAAGKNHKINLGIQVFSGDSDPNDGISEAFLAQYGAFHRYNGRMDYTERTVRTYNHAGILNPYLIQDFKFTPKWGLIWESHLHGTTTAIQNPGNGTYDGSRQIYGWENDFRFRYKPNSFTSIELAYLFMLANDKLTYLPAGTGGNPDILPQFAYLEITWTPELFRHRSKTKW